MFFSDPIQTCGENEEFDTCGTHCPEKCGDDLKEPRICIASCKVGCSCIAGHVLNDKGKCILKKDC